MLAESDRRTFLKELRKPGIDNLRKTQICKKVNEICKKCKECPYCQSLNGLIKKIGPLKIAHDRFAAFNKSMAVKKVAPARKREYDHSFSEAKKRIPDLEKHLHRALEDLDPLHVLNLFKKISPSDCELLGLDPLDGRPEMFIWQYLPAPPVCIRPSVAQQSSSTEDDLTTKLAEIVQVCGLIRTALVKGAPITTLMEQWEFLQFQMAMYINSELPGLTQARHGKPIRGFSQRLKGKQGRFRGNLSGKRVDFSGRTVISPDPNLAINEVAVPQLVAKNLSYPERVNHINIRKLRNLVLNGPAQWPGAKTIIKKDDGGYKLDLNFGNKEQMARDLKVGDTVERHLEDGDIVLFNRQPSLHKLSIMSHLVKVRPWRTFRLNECVCGPYNADFDGDEMNLHVPQTEEARAEALILMGVKHNLATPKNGEPIIAATQDFITAAYLISSKDRFFTRHTFTYMCAHMTGSEEHLDIPPPAILKPQALWTGKQVFNMMMRPNKSCKVKVNLDAKCKAYKRRVGETPDMDPDDNFLVVRNSEVMCGRMDKSTVGSGKKDSVFYVILRDYGPDEAVTAMNRLARLCARFMGNYGLSIGIFDVFPLTTLREKIKILVREANLKCDELIHKFNTGKLEKSAGCNLDQTLENSISGVLSKVRSTAGDLCLETLSKHNAPLTMATSGSKGLAINVAQMVAVVGQQIIGGQRVPNGFQDRSLPHFPKNVRNPASKGFVQNSFYSGLLPTEFLFHAISGREGLVDTAVKTAETGYMSRRLMKSLEDLSTQYDNTVRTSAGDVVQFQFGSDGLDPVDMEGSAVPVNFERSWTHAESITWSNAEPSLQSAQIMALCDSLLADERAKYTRRHLVTDALLDYNDQSDASLDLQEGARKFLDDVRQFVQKRADRLTNAKERLVETFDASIASHRSYIDKTAKVSEKTLRTFVVMCLDKFRKAHVEPGHAVGAVGAQSIGEPGTQMTLKTFHFAGVAGMSITEGVPRIKEIINASKKINTPIITCPLQNPHQIEAAHIVKGRIEKTYISDVLKYVEEEWDGNEGRIILKVDQQALNDLQLGVGLGDIATSICRQKKLKIDENLVFADRFANTITIIVRNGGADRGSKRTPAAKAKASLDNQDLLFRVNFLRRQLPAIGISGYPDAARAVIQTEKEEHTVYVEGYGLRECINTEGVIGTGVVTNSIMECLDILGIEAARKSIAVEIKNVMRDMNIDPRHMELLADVMTYKGQVLGITRFGLAKMRDSVLQLASFEKTPDHLFDAVAGLKEDPIQGVSESVIMGQSMSVGTGGFGMIRRLGLRPDDFAPQPTVFEDAWNAASKM